MSLDQARLSSLATAVADLASLTSELADELEGGLTAEAAVALIEAERSLHMAGRAVERARRVLDAG